MSQKKGVCGGERMKNYTQGREARILPEPFLPDTWAQRVPPKVVGGES